MKKKNKKIHYVVGDILEVETFAGPKVYKKVSKIIDSVTKWADGDSTHLKGFEGSFVRRKDLYALRERHVPYTGMEKLSGTSSFTFDRSVVRAVKRS
jgi:hypothetical protein